MSVALDPVAERTSAERESIAAGGGLTSGTPGGGFVSSHFVSGGRADLKRMQRIETYETN